MTTLYDIISTLDERLIQAEQAGDAALLPDPRFTVQEKMRKYVLVHIEAERLAIPIEGLAEIGPMPAVTPLPNLPRWIQGIINQRGEIISVIDLRLLLQESGSEEADGKKKLAVLRNGTMKVGIGIDQVVTTVSRPESDCVPSAESPFSKAAPKVFDRSLRMENTLYQILQPAAFLGMERLMRYHPQE